MPHKPCAVIPVYNHAATVEHVVRAMSAVNLPCVVVDDGSTPTHARTIRDITSKYGARLLRRHHNGGKGAAVQDGLKAAARAGYTHALQVDADGQHDLGDVPRFLQHMRDHPEAVICGAPSYGRDAPLVRRYGRLLTRVWVWINTLSLDIPDAMCGFRVYPLRPVGRLLQRVDPGQRMDFDVAILVRLHWQGVPMRWLPTQVIYPVDGVSHFRALRDNLIITRMHAGLFVGMTSRLPLWALAALRRNKR